MLLCASSCIVYYPMLAQVPDQAVYASGNELDTTLKAFSIIEESFEPKKPSVVLVTFFYCVTRCAYLYGYV